MAHPFDNSIPPYLILLQQDGIRQGYWAVHDAAVNGIKIDEDVFPFMSSRPHIEHCVDLIRQSLMCQPDLTIEVKDPEIGGVTGFGTEHQCRRWDQLLDWVKKWEGYKQEPRTNGSSMEHSQHHHHSHDTGS